MTIHTRHLRRLGPLLLCAVAFGAGAAVLKGNGSGIRDALGNVSAPWLLLPFVVGAAAGRGKTLIGAVTGLILSLIALASFYVANSFVLQLGPHPWVVDLRLAVDGGRRFFLLALLSGPVFGALGTWWRRTGLVVIPLAVAALFILEPIAQLALRSSGSGAVGAGEILVGTLAAVLIIRFTPKRVAT